jgi:hypothetical protein
VGIEAGLTFANARYDWDPPAGFDDDGNYDHLTGVKFGLVLDAAAGRNFHIQPGIFINQKGYRDENGLGQDYHYRVNYVELPLYFHAVFGPRRVGQFFIGGGPYVAAALSGRYVNDDTNDDDDLEFGENYLRDDFKRGDAGLNFDFGFQSAIGLFGRVNFGHGLVNITPDENNPYDLKELNRTISLTAGWMF